MGRVLRASRLLVAVFFAVGLLAACGDDDGGPQGPQPVDLSGTYVLQTISVNGNPIAGTTGELRLTSITTYEAIIDFPEESGIPDVDDNGTYEALDNGTWSQDSNTGLPSVQGTWSLVGNTFTVATVGVVDTENVWIRQ